MICVRPADMGNIISPFIDGARPFPFSQQNFCPFEVADLPGGLMTVDKTTQTITAYESQQPLNSMN